MDSWFKKALHDTRDDNLGGHREGLLIQLRAAVQHWLGPVGYGCPEAAKEQADRLILAAVSPWIRVTEEAPGPKRNGRYLVTIRFGNGSKEVREVAWNGPFSGWMFCTEDDGTTGPLVRVLAYQPLPPPMEDTP